MSGSSKTDALCCSTTRNHLECVKILLAADGVTPLSKDEFGCTALHYVESVEALELLLAVEGCDVNARNYYGRTLLSETCTFVVDCGSKRTETTQKVVARLLEVPGIDVLAEDDDGDTARDMCSDDDVIEMLREAEERQRTAKE